MRRTLALGAALALLGGCASVADRPAAVERMYVISCGENHAKDLARWSAPDAGRALCSSTTVT